MAAPTNISALTATDIATVPADVMQTVDDAGTTYTVWYKATATVTAFWGLFGFGDLSVYKPDTAIFLGPAASPVPYIITNTGDNKCCYFPVTAGLTYYFRFQTNSGNPSPAVLTINLQAHVNTDAPIGSIAVNDDAPNSSMGLALLDSTDSLVSVLRYIPPPIGNNEGVGVIDSGVIALGDATTTAIIIYNTAYETLASVPNALSGSEVTSNRSDRFYATNFAGSDFWVEWFGVDGAIEDQTSPLTLSGGLKAIGVSPDETVLYYYGTAASLTPIKRWDLTNDIALSNLVTMTGKAARDMVVLADGRIVVADTTNDMIEIYSAAGTLVDSFAAVSVGGDRLTRGLTDDTVWVWNKTSVGDSQEYFREYQVSDGTMVTEIHGTSMFDNGSYMGSAVASPLRFGNSNSCPFWITRSVTIPTFVNGPAALEAFEASGALRAFDVPRVRVAPHLADENDWIFYSKFELDLESGVGTVTGQGVDPVVLFRYSDDGGFTWSAWRQLTVGRLGEYRWQCLTWRLGMARDRVFMIRQTDPVKTAWLAAYLEFEGEA